MSSKAFARIDASQISNMDLTISFTMPVSEWRELMKQQPEGWPSYIIGRQIASVLGHIAKSTEMTFREPVPNETII